MKIIIFDTETTGLLQKSIVPLEKQPKIIEIGALFIDTKYKTHPIRGELSQLLNPQEPLPEIITKITGITDNDLVGMPTFEDYYEQLVDFFKGANYWIAHNAPFDMGMLSVELERLSADFPSPSNRVICTIQEYKTVMGKWPKETELYEFIMGKPLEQSHRALDDVKHLYEILVKDKFIERLLEEH